MKYTVLIEVEITTDKDRQQINAGINRGLYYGLDVKHVAKPSDVKITHVLITEK